MVIINTIVNYFLLFIIYSIIGYIAEVLSCTIIDKKLSFFRGFLIGPWIPIYGYGAIIMVLLLSRFKGNYVLLFILGLLVCSILEYLASFLMEKIFGLRWWDYSNDKINLNGRVCLRNALLFGLGGVIVIEFVHPLISLYFYNIDINIRYIMFIVLFIAFALDMIISNVIVTKLKNKAIKYSSPDVSEEIKASIIEEVKKHLKLNIRVVKAYPNFKKYNNAIYEEFINRILEARKEMKKKINKVKESLKK